MILKYLFQLILLVLLIKINIILKVHIIIIFVQKTNSNSNVDIPLKDRRNEFIKNNISLCEANCEFIDYNIKNKKVKCSCKVKEASYIRDETDINGMKIAIDLKRGADPDKLMQRLFKIVGAPSDPSEIGVSRQKLREIVPYAQLMRARINLLDLAKRAEIYD